MPDQNCATTGFIAALMELRNAASTERVRAAGGGQSVLPEIGAT
jgi:hypothetical protein